MSWGTEMSVKILHFADAHIDSYTGGRIDPQNGLPFHMNDFLKALDEIIDTAIEEKVQLVLFAGDAYRNPTPPPTSQREWQRRIARLSEARIPLLMIPGNHDINSNTFKASALQEMNTLSIPYVHLAGKRIGIWKPEDLDGVPVQVIAVPWMPISIMSARDAGNVLTEEERAMKMEEAIVSNINKELEKADPDLPVILLAHYSVQGSKYPNGQEAGLGREVTLSKSIACDPRFSYTALGHIHLFQDLNTGQQPPVLYSGSIERVNYGEANSEKGFIIAEVENHHTRYTFRPLHTRRMFNIKCEVRSAETMQQELLDLLPSADEAQGAMIRLEFSYPHEWQAMLNERQLREKAAGALDFQLKRNPVYPTRIRIQSGNAGSLSPKELLEQYCLTTRIPDPEAEALRDIAEQIFSEAETEIRKE